MGERVNRLGESTRPVTGATISPGAGVGQPLRRKAEALVSEGASTSPPDSGANSPAVLRKTVHELQVHQIELELQNEELRRTQVELDAARSRYFELYDLAPVGYCTLTDKGMVLEANLTAATLLGVARSALVGRALSTFVLDADQDVYYRHRRQLAATGAPQACDLRMLRVQADPFWARLEAISSLEAGGAHGWRLVIIDIDERKRAEVALERANQDLLDLTAKLHASNESLEVLVDVRTADLQRRTRQLRALALALTRTEERERRNVAQVIHDNLQQLLAVARINLELVGRRPEAAALLEDLSRIDQLVVESLTVVRTLTAELSPSVLYRSGLAAALRWLGHWFEENHGLSVRVTVDDDTAIESEELRLALFRCVRELLMNVVRHAGVKDAILRVRRLNTLLQIVVSDARRRVRCGRLERARRQRHGPGFVRPSRTPRDARGNARCRQLARLGNAGDDPCAVPGTCRCRPGDRARRCRDPHETRRSHARPRRRGR